VAGAINFFRRNTKSALTLFDYVRDKLLIALFGKTKRSKKKIIENNHNCTEKKIFLKNIHNFVGYRFENGFVGPSK